MTREEFYKASEDAESIDTTLNNIAERAQSIVIESSDGNRSVGELMAIVLACRIMLRTLEPQLEKPLLRLIDEMEKETVMICSVKDGKHDE